jgi:uncharacterized membrane protein YqjE
VEGKAPRQRITAVEEKSFGELVTRVSENVSLLVREEIELARAEVEQKVKRIVQGAVVGAVAGFFVLLGLIYLLHSAAWGLNDLLDGVWQGFLIVGAALFALAAVGGLFAVRSFKKGAPPTPDQAIEEARLIREALEHPEVQAAGESRPARPEE